MISALGGGGQPNYAIYDHRKRGYVNLVLTREEVSHIQKI